MQLYYEYALTPMTRSGTMVPKSALPDIYNRPDSGYCTVFAFDKFAAEAIRAQSNSQGLGRFPVYSDRLWIDIDRDNLSEANAYTKIVANILKRLDYSFSVWESGGKGYHVCVKISPMFGHDVPHSQRCFVETLQLQCDYSLYQHGRLLSNPGRIHPKTKKKKSKVWEYIGSVQPSIPIVQAPIKSVIETDLLTNEDLIRLAYSRLGSFLLDAPLPGNRHTAIWSIAMQMFEAGMPHELVLHTMLFLNSQLPSPKSKEEVCLAINQALAQSGKQTCQRR